MSSGAGAGELRLDGAGRLRRQTESFEPDIRSQNNAIPNGYGVVFIVSRKPRDSGVVLRRLTGEKKSSFCVRIKTTGQSKKTQKEDLSMKKERIDINSLAHTK